MKGDATTQNKALASLKEVYDYNPKTGLFVFKVDRGSRKKGDVAGAKHKQGYIQLNYDGKFYLAHRAAWAFVHGSFPEDIIDHLNGVKSDNRISNLRSTTMKINMENLRRAKKSNTSGLLGAHKAPKGKFHAKIQVNRKCIYLGQFDSPEEAHHRYVEAKREMHEGNML